MHTCADTTYAALFPKKTHGLVEFESGASLGEASLSEEAAKALVDQLPAKAGRASPEPISRPSRRLGQSPFPHANNNQS